MMLITPDPSTFPIPDSYLLVGHKIIYFREKPEIFFAYHKRLRSHWSRAGFLQAHLVICLFVTMPKLPLGQ